MNKVTVSLELELSLYHQSEASTSIHLNLANAILHRYDEQMKDEISI